MQKCGVRIQFLLAIAECGLGTRQIRPNSFLSMMPIGNIFQNGTELIWGAITCNLEDLAPILIKEY